MSDQIGLPFVLDDSQALKKLQRLENELEDLKRVTQGYEAANRKAFSASGRHIDLLKKKVSGLESSLSSGSKASLKFGTVFKGAFVAGAALTAITAITRGIKEFGNQAIVQAENYEQLEISFKTFLKSASLAKKVLADLTEFSNKTPYEPEQVYQAGKALLAFGIEHEKLIPTLKSIGDVAAATGKDFNELAIIYGKARTQGTLFAEDINQLTEAGVPIIAELAKQFGVAEGQVKKLGSEGKITFANLEQAFKDMTSEGGRFHNLMEEQSESLKGLKSTGAGLLNELAKQIGNKFLPLLKSVQRLINGVLGSMVKWFDDGKTAAQEQIEALKGQNAQSVVLFDTLRNLNRHISGLKEGTKEYNAAVEAKRQTLNKINKEYGDYLPNLLTEESTLRDIEIAQKAVNKEFVKRQLMLAYEEEMGEIIKQRIAHEKELIALQENKANNVVDQHSQELAAGGLSPHMVEQQEKLMRTIQDGAINHKVRLIENTTESTEKTTAQYQKLADSMGIAFSEILAALNGVDEKTEKTFENTGDKTKKGEDAAKKYASALDDLNKRIQQFELDSLSGPEKLRLEWRIAQEELEKLKMQLANYAKAAGLAFDSAPIDKLIEDTARKFKQEISDALVLEPLAQQDIDKFLPELKGVDIKVRVNSLDLEGFNTSLEKAIGDALDLDVTQFAALKQTLTDVYNSIGDIIASGTQAQIDANQAIIDSLRDRISKSEEALRHEQDEYNKGHANNVDSKRRELAALQTEEEKAHKKQTKLKKKQLRQELIFDQIQQTSNLITASAKIFNSTSGIPFVGIGLAIAAIAGMFASFTKFKQQSEALQYQPLFKGGRVDQFLSGKSDKNGGKGHRVENSRLTLGGNEMVVNGVSTSKNPKFLDRFNSGEFDHLSLDHITADYFKRKKAKIISIDAKRAERIEEGNRVISQRKTEVDLKIESAISQQTLELKKYFDEKPDYIPTNDGYIEKTKSKSTRKRIPA